MENYLGFASWETGSTQFLWTLVTFSLGWVCGVMWTGYLAPLLREDRPRRHDEE